MLISETHFTDKSIFEIAGYHIYHTNHPDNAVHAGSAILKNTIDHYPVKNAKRTSSKLHLSELNYYLMT